MNQSMIPRETVLKIVREKGQTDISGIMSGLTAAGFKYPADRKPETEGDPYMLDLERTINAMATEGDLKRSGGDNGDKFMYSIPSNDAIPDKATDA